MNRLLLGVIGHVDHGKTALVRALTGMETDRLPEERRRGISIALGFAHFTLDGAGIDIVDMPGHERFVRTMVSGATGIDAVLLVVSANEGVKPQTAEHVNIAGLLGLRRAVVVVTKADLASPEEAAVAGLEAAEIAAAAGLAAADPVITSATTGQGMDGLRRAIADVLREAEPREDAGFPYLPVDRVFSMAGHGTVVTGTLRRGVLTAGAELELVPGGLPVRVRGLQVHGRAVTEAPPGARVAVNLRGAEMTQVARGAALATRGALPPSRWLTVQVRSVPGAPVLATTTVVQLLFGTEEVAARLRLLDRDTLQPGETAPAQLRCAAPVAVPARERLILRLPAPAGTVAGGLILDAEAVRLRRNAPGVLARVAGLAAADLCGIARLELAARGAAGLDVARLARLGGVSGRLAAAALAGLPVVLCAGHVAVARPVFEALLAQAGSVLAAEDRAFSREQIAARLPGVAPAVLEEALARRVAGGTVRPEGGGVRAVRAERDSARLTGEAALAARLADELRRGGLTPPDAYAIAPDPQGKRMLERLIREGVVVRARDTGQKRDVLFHQDAIEQAQRRLTPLLQQPPGLLVKEAGTALGISRKYSVPLMEHLDSIRFTRRIADRRILAPPK